MAFVSDDTSWPCSFVSSCDALGYDVGRARAGLLRLAESLNPTGATATARSRSVARRDSRRAGSD